MAEGKIASKVLTEEDCEHRLYATDLLFIKRYDLMNNPGILIMELCR